MELPAKPGRFTWLHQPCPPSAEGGIEAAAEAILTTDTRPKIGGRVVRLRGRDVTIDVNCVFEGEVNLADGVSIGPNCVIRDARIEAGAQILAFTHIDGATVGPASRVGPYARLRPGTVLGEETHVGNFVELKNAKFDTQAKANHLDRKSVV